MAPRKVLFDTTVLCGAFLKPTQGGLCMALLEFARIGVVEPVFTQEVVGEWVRLAKSGHFGGIRYDDEDLDAFCDLLAPLLTPETLEQVRLGRVQVPIYPVATAGGVRMITQHPTAGRAQTRTHVLEEGTLVLKDPADAHLFQVALDQGCDFLCTSNTRDLPEGLTIGSLTLVTPESLMATIRADLVEP